LTAPMARGEIRAESSGMAGEGNGGPRACRFWRDSAKMKGL